MSEGPIKRERAAWEPARGTRPSASLHFAADKPASSYCGRKGVKLALTNELAGITCSDCLAALRADRVIK